MDFAVERATAQARLESLVGQLNNVEQTGAQLRQQIVETQGVMKWLDARIQADATVPPPSDEAPAP